jgi:hypothetical protein
MNIMISWINAKLTGHAWHGVRSGALLAPVQVLLCCAGAVWYLQVHWCGRCVLYSTTRPSVLPARTGPLPLVS